MQNNLLKCKDIYTIHIKLLTKIFSILHQNTTKEKMGLDMLDSDTNHGLDTSWLVNDGTELKSKRFHV